MTKTDTTKNDDAPTQRSADVERFLTELGHPHKDVILALRETILRADPAITEGIKWNAPSFRTTEYFATFHLRAKRGVQVILHLGAKKRPDVTEAIRVADPELLLQWLGVDRACVVFRDMDDAKARQGAFVALLRAWIEHV